MVICIKKFLIYLIRGYQVLPLYSHSMCRFSPTCSEYMIEAINTYGVIKGVRLGIKRIARCHPGGDFGYDPVIKKGNIK